jgi:hypothetical protein
MVLAPKIISDKFAEDRKKGTNSLQELLSVCLRF